MPEDPADFEKHYFGTHVPLIDKTPGLLENKVRRMTRQFVGESVNFLSSSSCSNRPKR